MMHYLNYIDGEWCDSEQALTVMNPGTAEAYATIAEATITDADRAMAAARRVSIKAFFRTFVQPSEPSGC